MTLLITAVSYAVAAGAGFGLGRIKNAKKLAAAKAVVTSVDNSVKAGVADVKTEAAKIETAVVTEAKKL